MRDKVFCPMCGSKMQYVKTKAHQHGFDMVTKLPLCSKEDKCKIKKLQGGCKRVCAKRSVVFVSRVFFGCSKCMTVVWFDFREDGKRGDLSLLLAEAKRLGVSVSDLLAAR